MHRLLEQNLRIAVTSGGYDCENKSIRKTNKVLMYICGLIVVDVTISDWDMPILLTEQRR